MALQWSCFGVHDSEGGDSAIPARLISLDKTPLSLHLSTCVSFLSLLLSPRVPASGYLWDGEEERGRGGLVSSPPPHPTVPQGALGLVCDLVSHMIETHLILLGINILQWNRGDSRREKRGEDESQDG